MIEQKIKDEATRQCADVAYNSLNDYESAYTGFIKGSTWMKDIVIQETIEWIKNNIDYYAYLHQSNGKNEIKIIDEFSEKLKQYINYEN